MVMPYLCGQVLDVGCGITDIPSLLQPGQRYVGVDRADMVRWLHENRPAHTYHVCDLDRDDLALNDQFDTILLMAVIEHLKNPDKLLAQLPTYLKADGRLLITTPSPFGDTLHQIGAGLGLFYAEAAREKITLCFPPKELCTDNAAMVAGLGYRLFKST